MLVRVMAVVISLIELLASRASCAQDLPSVEITRFISPAGIEHTTLRCSTHGQATACQVIRERNGTVLSTITMSAKEVGDSLKRYFRRVPRAEIYPNNAVPMEKWEQKDGVMIAWHVSTGRLVTKGSAAYEREGNPPALTAIVSLEMDLSTLGIDR